MKKLLLLLSLIGLLMSCDLLFGPKEEEPVIGVAPVGIEEVEKSIFTAFGRDFTQEGFTRHFNYSDSSDTAGRGVCILYYINDDISEIVAANLYFFTEPQNPEGMYNNELARGIVEWCAVEENTNYGETTPTITDVTYFEATSKKTFNFTHETDKTSSSTVLNKWQESTYHPFDGFFFENPVSSGADESIHAAKKNTSTNKLEIGINTVVKKLEDWQVIDDSYKAQ